MNTYRTVSAILAAGAVAAIITILPGTSEKVSASAPHGSAPKAECTTQSWPHYDAACIRDTRNADGLARTVRVIQAGNTTR